MTKEIFGPAFWSGAVGVTVYFLFENIGLKYTTASAASLIIASIPAITLLEQRIRGVRLPVRQWAGALVSIVGVGLVVGYGQSHLLGNVLMVGACLCWVAFNHISPRLMDKCSSFAASTLQNTFGFACLLPLSLLEIREWAWPSLNVWLHLLFLAAACSVAGYFLYNYGLRHTGRVTATVYLNLMPLVGAVGGMLVLGERFGLWQILGGVLLVGSVAVATMPGRERNGGGT